MGNYRELYIVRHGKAVSDYLGISDIDRPLKERGIVDGISMAKRLLAKKINPEYILSSPAIRALHSALIFSRTFGISSDLIHINEQMYMSGTSTLLDIIKNTEDNVNSLMIFGHNPTFTDLANQFLNNKTSLPTGKIDNIPTSGVVGIKFQSSTWKEISAEKVLNSFFDYPKNSL